MCMFDGGDDQWAFLSQSTPKARKSHRCGECRRMIEVGEHYSYTSGLYDGSWSEFHQCEQCAATVRWLDVVCQGWVYNMIQEDLLSHVTGEESYIRSRPLARLCRWMLADWRDRAGDLRSVEAVRAVTDEAVGAYRRKFEKATH